MGMKSAWTMENATAGLKSKGSGTPPTGEGNSWETLTDMKEGLLSGKEGQQDIGSQRGSYLSSGTIYESLWPAAAQP